MRGSDVIRIRHPAGSIKRVIPFLREGLFILGLLYSLLKTALLILIKRKKVLITNNGIECITAYYLKRFGIIKHVISIIHDTSSLEFLRVGFISKIQNQLWINSDLIITVSKTMKERIQNYYPYQRIEVIYSGI